MKMTNLMIGLALSLAFEASIAQEVNTKHFTVVHPNVSAKLSAQSVGGHSRTGRKDKDCTESSDKKDDGKTCQIDIVVDYDESTKSCLVDIETTVLLANRTPVEWNIVENPSSNYKITFTQFKSIKPILFVDTTDLGEDTSSSDSDFQLRPKGKTSIDGVYYFIFLKWTEKKHPGHNGICQVVDPTIANN